MNNIIIPGRDSKICYISYEDASLNLVQGIIKRFAIDIVDTNIQLGNITQSYSMVGYDDVGQIKRSRSIFSNTQQNIVPRGSVVQNIGNSGHQITIRGYISGQFFNRRDQIIMALNSGKPLKLYLPYYQRMNSAKNVSAINKTSKTSNFFYVKPIGRPTIDDSEQNIGSCQINITFQEIPYSTKNKKESKITNILDYVGSITDTFTDFEVAADIARQTLTRLNASIYNITQIANNAGQDVRSLFSMISGLNNNIDKLLKSPSDLISNYTDVFIEVFLSQTTSNATNNDIISAKNTQNASLLSVKTLASFNDDKSVKSSVINIQGKEFDNLTAIKENIIEGKIVFATYSLALLMLIGLIDTYYFENISQIAELRSILTSLSDKIFKNTMYNGLQVKDSSVIEYTNPVFNPSLGLNLYKLTIESLNTLRDIEQNISKSRTEVLSRDYTLMHLIFRYYNAYVNYDNIDNIVKNFMNVNNITEAQAMIKSGTKIFIPDILIN